MIKSGDTVLVSDKPPARRAAPRVEVMGQLHGLLVALRIPLVVRNLSSGGFAVEGVVAFPAGAIHTFRFTSPNGPVILVRAAAQHCRLVPTDADQPRYLAGFSFVHDPTEQTERGIEVLLDAAKSQVVFQ